MANLIPMTADQFQALLAAIKLPAPQLTAERIEQFRAQDIGFLDPDNDAKISVETIDGETVYHNVFSFTVRLKARTAGVTSGAYTSANLAAKLDVCLRGDAHAWYINEISATTRAGLKSSIELWCTELEERFRFRIAPTTALNRIERLRYTTLDCRLRKSPEDYVQEIIILVKGADLGLTEKAQVAMAYNHFGPELRQWLPLPDTEVSLTEFMKAVTSAKANWFELYRPFT